MRMRLLPAKQAWTALRFYLGVVFIIHGTTRMVHGTVGDFGDFLRSSGFPLGHATAWGITVFELAGGALFALGFAAAPIGLFFMFELAMGIILVHRHFGWFVVGGGTNGMEYSVVLIVALFACVCAANDKPSGGLLRP